jgi:hypothetical protein
MKGPGLTSLDDRLDLSHSIILFAPIMNLEHPEAEVDIDKLVKLLPPLGVIDDLGPLIAV